jgi:X-linked retinitis pigmentosa GTPase regulator
LNFCLALSTDGRLFSWGKNEFGQLGLGNKTQELKVNFPNKIAITNSNNFEISEIFCGEEHCGFTNNKKEAFIWGYGNDGRLGNKKNMNLNTPSKLLIEDKNIEIKKIACGGHHTAILSDKGDLYMCGNGRDGELGNGNILQSASVSRNYPIFVYHFKLSNEKVVDVSCGSSHTLALVEMNDYI